MGVARAARLLRLRDARHAGELRVHRPSAGRARRRAGASGRPPLLPRDAPRRHGGHRPAAGRRRPAEGSGRQPGGAWCSRSRSATISPRRWNSIGNWRWNWRRRRSTGSITTSGRRPSRTSWRSGSATASSSPSGTGDTSITCRSPWPKPWASRTAAATTIGRGRCGTWCRTTCSSCSRSRRWSRPSRCRRRRCGTSG